MKFTGKFILIIALLVINLGCILGKRIKKSKGRKHIMYDFLEMNTKHLEKATEQFYRKKRNKISLDPSTQNSSTKPTSNQNINNDLTQDPNNKNPQETQMVNNNQIPPINSKDSTNSNNNPNAKNQNKPNQSKISVKKIIAIGKAIYNRLYVYEGSLLYKLKKLNVLKEVKFEELNNNIIVQSLKSIFDQCQINADSIKKLKDQFDIGFEEGLKWLNENGKIEYNGKFTYTLKNEVKNQGGCENSKETTNNQNLNQQNTNSPQNNTQSGNTQNNQNNGKLENLNNTQNPNNQINSVDQKNNQISQNIPNTQNTQNVQNTQNTQNTSNSNNNNNEMSNFIQNNMNLSSN